MNHVHPTAVIAAGVELGDGNTIGPYAVILGPARIGDGNWIGPHVVIGPPAEIRGIDASATLTPDAVQVVRDALNEHHVIFFRDQSLTPDQQAAFAARFGTVTEAHPVLPSIAESPQVLAIDGAVDRAQPRRGE